MQNIILFIILIFIILTLTCTNQKEKYINSYGNYLDAPFIEPDDTNCRDVCNNMSDCKGYIYDPLSGSCKLNSGKNGTDNYEDYLSPYSDHPIYPYYDDYLYKNAWWLFGPTWLNSTFFGKGYRNVNKYGGHHIHHYDPENIPVNRKEDNTHEQIIGSGGNVKNRNLLQPEDYPENPFSGFNNNKVRDKRNKYNSARYKPYPPDFPSELGRVGSIIGGGSFVSNKIGKPSGNLVLKSQ
jgi:hypothetical protein